MHGDAGQRRHHVLADEAAALGKGFDISIQKEGGVGQLAPSLGGIDEEGADAAIHVDEVVGAGGAGLVGELVKLVLAL